MIMIKISLKYDTAWGENLVLSSEGRRMPMKYRAGGVWDVVFEADEAVRTLAYSFLVERDGEVIRKEWRSHSVKLAAGYSDVDVEYVGTERCLRERLGHRVVAVSGEQRLPEPLLSRRVYPLAYDGDTGRTARGISGA